MSTVEERVRVTRPQERMPANVVSAITSPTPDQQKNRITEGARSFATVIATAR